MSQTLTQAHRDQLKPWAQKWIKNSLSTDPMTAEDRAIMRKAIDGQYLAANLKVPRNIVFVSSPFIVRYAGGFAAAIWRMKEGHKPTNLPKRSEIVGYPSALVEAAMAASSDVGRDELIPPQKANAPDYSKWYVYPEDPLQAANALGLGAYGMNLAGQSYDMWRGNNQWSAWAAYLSFFRHIVKLPLDYSKWQHYETACLHAGPMVMHPEFCIVSDRPEFLAVDEQNRPHNDNGPFARWRDGAELCCVHGTRIPSWILATPEKITVEKIEAESNTSVRRVMTDKYGTARYLIDSKAQVIATDDFGTLYRKEVPGDEAIVMCKVIDHSPDESGTIPEYFIGVPPDMKTPKQAIAWTFGKKEDEYNPDLQT